MSEIMADAATLATVLDDACDEAGCAHDNEALLASIATLRKENAGLKERREIHNRMVSDWKNEVVKAETRARAAEAQAEAMRNALEFYANPKNWWNADASNRLEYHNANLGGSMERMNARVGVVEKHPNSRHPHFYNDGGDRARAALSSLLKFSARTTSNSTPA